MKKNITLIALTPLCALICSSCVVSEESAATLDQISTIASILVDEQDAQKLETLLSIGEIIITVENSK